MQTNMPKIFAKGVTSRISGSCRVATNYSKLFGVSNVFPLHVRTLWIETFQVAVPRLLLRHQLSLQTPTREELGRKDTHSLSLIRHLELIRTLLDLLLLQFQSVCAKYNICHEKVSPSHTKFCTSKCCVCHKKVIVLRGSVLFDTTSYSQDTKALVEVAWIHYLKG